MSDKRERHAAAWIAVLVVLPVIVPGVGLLAQQPAALPTMSVTASRSERPLDADSKSVSVVTREQIATRNARSVQELLEEIPGVSLSRAGGIDGQIVIRGSNSNDSRTVLFIDGDRFRGRNTLEYTLLDPNEIERIEVVRGPASALYGPDAMAGLVNIITRRARRVGAGPFHLAPRAAALNASSVNHLLGGRVELEGAGGAVDLLVGLNARRADNYQSPRGTVPNSDFTTRSADLQLGYMAGAGRRFELTMKQAQVVTGRAGGIGGAPGDSLVQLREEPNRESFVKVGFQGTQSGLGFLKTEASLYARRLYTHIAVANRTAPNRLVESENWVDGPLVTGGKLIGVRAWGANLLTVGVDFFHEHRKGTEQATTTTSLDAAGNPTAMTAGTRMQSAPDATQTNIGLLVHNDWDPTPQWTVSVGIREDYIRSSSETTPVAHPSLQPLYDLDHEKATAPVTGSIGLIYRPWETVHLIAGGGKAFRAPGTFESFGSSRQGAGFLVPNPALQPEQATVYEIGARFRWQLLSVTATAFNSDYHNLIVTRPIVFLGTNSTQRQNVGVARLRGVEIDARWKPADRWQVSMNATGLRGTDVTSGRPLAYIAPLNGQLSVRHDVATGAHVEAVGKWSARKTRIDATQERETDGFRILNLYAGTFLRTVYHGLPNMRVIVGVENLFDAMYRQPTTVENINFARSNTNALVEPARAFSVSLRSAF